MLRRLGSSTRTRAVVCALLDGVSDQAAFDELSAAIVNGATPTGLLECAADAAARGEPKLPAARIRRDLTGDGHAGRERRASAMGSRHRRNRQSVVGGHSPRTCRTPVAQAPSRGSWRDGRWHAYWTRASWPCAVRAST